MDISRFLAVYANLPAKLRSQIVVVMDDEPMTWNAAYIEVSNETELGNKIVEKLTKMGII